MVGVATVLFWAEEDPEMFFSGFFVCGCRGLQERGLGLRPFAVGAVSAEVVETAARFPLFQMPSCFRDDVSLRRGDDEEVFAFVFDDADDRNVGAASIQRRFDRFVLARWIRRKIGYAGRLFVGRIGLGTPDTVG